MKVASLPLVLQAVLLSIVFPAVGDSANLGKTAYHRHGHHAHVSEIERAAFRGNSLEAKIHFCSECHGRTGQGFHGYYAIPQLAGQPTHYLENQFKAIHEHVRDDPLVAKIMQPYLRNLDPGLWPGLSQHFSDLHPRAHPGGPKSLVAEGKKIFEEGVPDANIPACSACHGEQAQGNDTVPRLAGQHYRYLLDELTDWVEGYRAKDPETPENPNVMQPIASSLTKAQITAVAAYLSRVD